MHQNALRAFFVCRTSAKFQPVSNRFPRLETDLTNLIFFMDFEKPLTVFYEEVML